MKETQATNPIRGEFNHKLWIQWLWGAIAVKARVVVSSIELEVDFKLMLAAAVHGRIGRARRAPSVQSMFASYLSMGQLMCLRLDARGARPVQPSRKRAARAHFKQVGRARRAPSVR